MIVVLVGLSLHQLCGQENTSIPDHQHYIKEIIFEGNKVTKPNILLRELEFASGDTINKIDLIPALENSRENLLNLSIFNFVNVEIQHIGENVINIKYIVTERWYIWPTPIFEHGERNLSTFLKEPRWDRLNYGLWLKWNNFRGRNELLNAKIRLGYKEQYVLQYEKPNLGKNENSKFFFSLSLSRRHRVNYLTEDNRPVYFTDEEDYAFNSSDVFLAYSYRPQLYSRHRIRLHYINDWISDTVAVLNPEFFGKGQTRYKHFRLDYVFRYDLRDSKIYPLEGVAYKFKMQKYGLGIIQDYPYENWEAEAGFFYHKKLADRLYFADVAKGKFSTRKELPLFQQQALGYTENMTAYDAFLIDGTDYFVNKLILKFQLLKPQTFSVPFLKAKQFSKVHYSMYLNLLGDIGYVYNSRPDPSNYMANALQYSTGIGIDFVTYYDKVFGIEYAINRYGMHAFFFHIATPFVNW